ncbi:hypothetical protein KFL_007960020 [Klebsormidium nitens]|uniref:Uncharacterized protein n=1 Tax=Klebsormidium nitens TaxID=105231 RepID=A0A1Y1IS73_KLENI|nr:hypothetical protein KFL_007960020 [Klebsormidium nitens]|eukprot:GAQ91497.1 hypothetical protein KFL_007960020 [Klebsormidium nitens]
MQDTMQGCMPALIVGIRRWHSGGTTYAIAVAAFSSTSTLTATCFTVEFLLLLRYLAARHRAAVDGLVTLAIKAPAARPPPASNMHKKRESGGGRPQRFNRQDRQAPSVRYSLEKVWLRAEACCTQARLGARQGARRQQVTKQGRQALSTPGPSPPGGSLHQAGPTAAASVAGRGGKRPARSGPAVNRGGDRERGAFESSKVGAPCTWLYYDRGDGGQQSSARLQVLGAASNKHASSAFKRTCKAQARVRRPSLGQGQGHTTCTRGVGQ